MIHDPTPLTAPDALLGPSRVARPTVGVVIPCYRYGRYLEECLHSVLDEQEGVDVRALIIDDCSPDDSAEVAERLAARDDRVEVWRHAVNKGNISTYNEGLLEWVDADYTVLLSADDLLAPGSLARAVAVLEANPNVGLVYGHAVDWDDSRPKPAARTRATGVTHWRGLDWLRILCGLGHTVITTPEVVMRTSVLKHVGGFRPELPHSGDTEIWMRFAAHCDIAYIKGADQAYYRIHGSNMTNERVPIVDLRQRKAAFDALFDRYSHLIRDAAVLRRKADRQMAKEALWRACRAYERRRMDTTPVAELYAFARETYPSTPRLPEYWGLKWREVAGPKVCPYLQPLMLSAVHRKVRKILFWRRWAREGV
jgi:glycosyltransferase involved in cell wall biosynthesis